MLDDLLTVSEVARKFEKSSATIRLWEKLGKIKAIKTASGMRLFQRSEVNRMARELMKQEKARVAWLKKMESLDAEDKG